jgi:O-antigen ligase
MEWITQQSRRYFRSDAPPPLAWFLAGFVYFLCSNYIFTASFIYNLGFYILTLPLFLYAVKCRPALVTGLPRTTGTIGLACFFCFVFLHALIWRYPDQSFLRTLRDTILTGLFATMAMAAFAEATPQRLLRPLVPVALICGCLTLLKFLPAGDFATRLTPMGRAHNPILGGNVYSVAGIIATWIFFSSEVQKRERQLALACIAVMTIVVLLTKSRGPIMALGIDYLLALLLFRQWKILALLSGGGLLFAADYAYLSSHGRSFLHADSLYSAVHDIFERRNSYRLPIWEKAARLVEKRPLQGYGMQAKFSLPGAPGAANPHNTFLATAYYTGLAGLALLLVPLGAAFAAAMRHLEKQENKLALLLLVHAVTATFTNLAQPVKPPSAIWLIYWLPIALALAGTAPGIVKKSLSARHIQR